MRLFDESAILHSYYVNALHFYNECYNFNVPTPMEWLYKEHYYRYNYNQLKYTIPKDNSNECLFNYYKFMYDTYPEGFGNIIRLHFYQSNGQINTSINLLDLFFELKAINDN